ncbi:MAG TPA: MoaD/ThiS family protein [Actinomycetaceae bacterium]|nr:MoaD/ThiS family protein [Actinomycetaceae bacterium]
MSAAIRVRYFAAAAEAAAVDEERLEAANVRELKEIMIHRHGPQLERVLTACSFLVEGAAAHDEAPIPAGGTVDVMPPFAGG